jgi:hypothetical protein
LHPVGRLGKLRALAPRLHSLALVVVGALVAGCGSEGALDERAVAEPVGRVQDLSLLALPGGEMAIGWRESFSPNDADAHAAFLRLAGRTLPVQRDENASTAASELVATEGTILRVLAERGVEDPDDWGLVAVVRDLETGELLPDIGYRTLPVFAGTVLTDLHLVSAPNGALLAWIERPGGELPADLVHLVALDEVGSPVGPPLALTELPTDVVRIDVASLARGQEAVLIALARHGESAQVWMFHFRVDDGVQLEERPQQLDANVSEEDRVVDLENGRECLELVLTQRGRPVRATLDLSAPADIQFQPLHHQEGDAPGVAPRLAAGAGGSLLYLYDRPDGATRVRAIEHGAGCEALVGVDRRFPLSRRRCAALATQPGEPLRYACATSCLTEDCGEQWIYFGRARF